MTTPSESAIDSSLRRDVEHRLTWDPAVTPPSIGVSAQDQVVTLTGTVDAFQRDPAWSEHLVFHEYFGGDDGRGLGASHQTGWTALVATLIVERGTR